MTTYKIFKDRIEVVNDFSSDVISSKYYPLDGILQLLSDAFYAYSYTSGVGKYCNLARICSDLAQIIALKPFVNSELIIDVVRQTLLIDRRRNFTKFSIIFVNEI